MSVESILGVSVFSGPKLQIGKLSLSTAGTNGTLLKGSPGKILSVSAYNSTASVKFLKLYNKAVAPTVGTDVSTLTIALVPGINTVFDCTVYGLLFTVGIAYAMTGLADTTDATPMAAGDVQCLQILYL